MAEQRLTLSEMASRLRVSVRTFKKDVIEKKIPFMKVGARMRFDPVAVEAYLSTFVVSKKTEFPKKGAKSKLSGGRYAEMIGL